MGSGGCGDSQYFSVRRNIESNGESESERRVIEKLSWRNRKPER